MARKSNGIVKLGAYAVGGLVAYKIATAGGFGPTIAKFVSGLKGTVGDTAGTALGGTPTPGATRRGTPPAGYIPPATSPGMDANNFVGPFENGWVVFVGGVQRGGVYTELDSAQRAYNIARGFPN